MIGIEGYKIKMSLEIMNGSKNETYFNEVKVTLFSGMVFE